MIKEGDKAIEFTLVDQYGEEHILSDYIGQWVLLYFYPKDNTPGCTKEACSIRDSFPNFIKLKAQVFGISVDIQESHKKFSDKYGLPFKLLANPKKDVLEKYDAAGVGRKRKSYLIDPGGIVRKVYKKVKPVEHADEALRDLEKLII